MSMVEQSVEDGGGDGFVLEDGAPFAEGLVGGDDDGVFFVFSGDELEEDFGIFFGHG